jgi:hypothetical protein
MLVTDPGLYVLYLISYQIAPLGRDVVCYFHLIFVKLQKLCHIPSRDT